MFRVLIVEDEPLERMALRTELEYGNYDIEQIYEADNGKRALELFEAERPEILIVDINIPVLSGLGLIKAVTAQGHPCKILITTAYDKSDYVRRALSMGVVGYLLKPIDEQELRNAVEKCQAMLSMERRQAERLQSTYQYSQRHLLRDCLHGLVPQRTLEEIGGWPVGGEFQTCLLAWLPGGGVGEESPGRFSALLQELFDDRYHTLSAQVDGMAVALIKPREREQVEQTLAAVRILSQVLYRGLTAGEAGCLFVGKPMASLEHIREFYESICGRPHGTGQSRIIRPSMPTGGLCPAKDRARLRQKWVNKLDTRQPAQIVGSVKRKLMQPGAYWPGACLFVEAFAQMDGEADLAGLFRCFVQSAPFNRLEAFLTDYFGEIPAGAEAPSNQLINTALEIMETQYARDLTQREVAEQLGLNQSYFSTLFKKVTGDNFSNALNTLRIRHAVQLMDAGETDMDAVAARCGYSNKKYFYEIFRKRTGSTVTEYIRAKR